MKRVLRSLTLSAFLPVIILLSGNFKAHASHIYGADFFYTHVSGNTYTVTLVLYGDCDLSNPPFTSLSSASPEVEIWNGISQTQVVTLVIQSPTSGVEVTPVCASQLNNTTCVSTTGTVPGIKKFTYSRNVNLGGTSANWRFYFNGDLNNSLAGRSNSITNISFGTGGNVMGLEATLNNTSAPNSSPTYTTIPTPFFCINKAAAYNPGTVDPNNDGLVYALVPGIETQTASFVTYLAGYSATSPLAVATGTFSFNTSTGQLNFTPNLVQQSLVVNKVSEYRNSVLVGTSMREMTFVVLNNCNNNPPRGNITNVSGGTFVDTVTVNACAGSGNLTFNINPTDPDGNSINVAASGIPAGASFVISNNNTTTPSGAFSWNLATVAAGTYNFFITYTDNGCPLSSKQTQAYTVTVLPKPSIAFALVSPATCAKKAKFNLTPGGSPSPWTITVFQGATTIHTITGVTGTQLDSLNPGTYTIRVTSNTTTCFRDTAITIALPPAIIPSVTMVKPTCNGGSNGSITVTASGGQAPFQYALGSPGPYSSNNVFTGLAAGSYTLYIKDANDCVKDTTVLLLDNPPITATVTFVMPPCNYYNSGVITITASNGTSPYQYALDAGPFSSTNTFSSLYSGTYVLHIKDANNCLKDSIFVLPDSIKVHAAATVTDILCNGDATGVITLAANSGTAPYQYKLGSGPLTGSGTFTGLTAGNHNFHIQDTNLCYLDTIVTLTEPAPITSTSVVTHVSCSGLGDGSITTTASGGVSPYTYALNAGAFGSSNTFNNLVPGSYTIHIKDANNCLKDTVIAITQPDSLAIGSVIAKDPSCYGYADGEITITGSGGTTPYTYAIGINAFTSANVFTVLVTGTYVLHIKDDNGCTKDTSITLSQPTAIVPSAQVSRPVCATLANGKVVLGATGGTPSYTYAMGAGPFGPSPTFSPVAAGSHIFHIMDKNLCVKDTLIDIVDSLDIKGDFTVTNVACNGDSTGAIAVTGKGGTGPYTYAKGIFGTYSSNNVFPNLLALTYLIKVKDANGCMWDTSVAVIEPTKLYVILGPQHVSCYKFNDGKVTLTGGGGTAPYTFAINGGSFGAANTFSNLSAGSYTLHVKDNNGCTLDTSVIITEPTAMTLALQVDDVLCFGDSSGKVTMTGSGGTPPYSYRKDFLPFQSSNVLTGINAGPHIFRIMDDKGCVLDSSIIMKEPPALLFTGVTAQHPTCEGFTDGSITVAGTGGTPAYQYAVNSNPYSNSPIIANLQEGAYVVHLKDNNGCLRDTNITLTGYPHIVRNVTPKDVLCFGDANGTITVDASGGVQPLTFSIGNTQQPQTDPVFTGFRAGSYTVTVTDDRNCKKDTVVTISEPAKLAVSVLATKNDCEGYDDGGTMEAKAGGGVEPYSYRWKTNPEQTTPRIGGMPNGTFMVVVTDANECADSTAAAVVYDNCCKPFVPDAFTPNGDGLNDVIRIRFKGDLSLEIFSIYNRFGQLVFTTNNIGQGWDGIFKGTPQDLGVYNYYIKGICGNSGGHEVEYKGTITLIR